MHARLRQQHLPYLWRGSLPTERPEHPERLGHLAMAAGLLMYLRVSREDALPEERKAVEFFGEKEALERERRRVQPGEEADKKLKQVINLYNILPKDKYNMDEKGCMMGIAAKVKVICRFEWKNPRLTHSGNRTWVTVIEAVSAVGVPVPPMIIKQGVVYYMGWYTGVQKSGDAATFSYSSKGWTDSKLGMEWLVENFDKHTSNINILNENMEEGGEDTGINKGTFLNYLFEARRCAYTKKNILATWDKADKSLQISITEREICEHISAQFRKSVAKKSARASTNDRKVLSKARVITSEDVEEKGSPIPKIERPKGRKKVTISDATIVYDLESNLEGGGGLVEEKLEWANIDDFSEIQTPPLPQKPRRCGRKKAYSR
ncbi:uncharacterized protein H6S33_012691 [Morchella sextelata]|uniref:uncharacterized protein n=1 Tax=Morchella sextelata TaxID=1174677 RepID=UPI001D03E944|nr:uncharacterized protein H6S33_012691 [Morchella sextelata]KAH0610145.1 hypothetical protein H6S33_012691 [Morchella sextelata]